MNCKMILTFLIAILSGSNAFGADIWRDWEVNADPDVIPILQYLDVSTSDKSNMVILGAGKKDGILEGTTLNAYRGSGNTTGYGNSEKVWVETGALKAINVQENVTIAKVVVAETEMSKMFFPEFPNVMAGDYAVIKRPNLTRKQIVTPTSKLSYASIFEDPKARPQTFEISRKGRREIMAAAKIFARSRLSLLMVEGYTDHKGPSNLNQIESYQRALTVRQFLIDELGFDPKRVLAIGYGEDEPVDSTLAPGYEETNRRIVFKAVPINL
jgi:hypothetical protein